MTLACSGGVCSGRVRGIGRQRRERARWSAAGVPVGVVDAHNGRDAGRR